MSDHSHKQLLALSPLDGRYADKTAGLAKIFSEYALIHRRIQVQADWFMFLADQNEISELAPISAEDRQWLENLVQNFSVEDALRVKEIERTTEHDLKACEYFLKEQCEQREELRSSVCFIHFACTSDDINNLAYALMLSDAKRELLLPLMEKIVQNLTEKAHKYAQTAMLSRTHGQAATPTTLGKEIANTVARLKRQLTQFRNLKLTGKLNGATGNYNAHHIAYPEVDWPARCRNFVSSFGLEFNSHTTQIEPHDAIAEYCHLLGRWNNILIDFSRDMWGYISLGYFAQNRPQHETGSSTMPHKINPIDFENGEGNLKLARALLDFFADALTISRWQRDLTDSTLMRNLGTALAYSLIGWQMTLQGVDRLRLVPEVLERDLDASWEVLSEPIQVLMRKSGMDNAYEKLKDLTKGRTFKGADIKALLEQLDLPPKIQAQLADLHPAAYTGLATRLAREIKTKRH